MPSLPLVKMASGDQFLQLEILSSTPVSYEEVKKTLGEFMSKNHVQNGLSQDTIQRLQGLHSQLTLSAPPTTTPTPLPPTQSGTLNDAPLPPTQSETLKGTKLQKKKKTKHKKEKDRDVTL